MTAGRWGSPCRARGRGHSRWAPDGRGFRKRARVRGPVEVSASYERARFAHGVLGSPSRVSLQPDPPHRATPPCPAPSATPFPRPPFPPPPHHAMLPGPLTQRHHGQDHPRHGAEDHHRHRPRPGRCRGDPARARLARARGAGGHGGGGQRAAAAHAAQRPRDLRAGRAPRHPRLRRVRRAARGAARHRRERPRRDRPRRDHPARADHARAGPPRGRFPRRDAAPGTRGQRHPRPDRPAHQHRRGLPAGTRRHRPCRPHRHDGRGLFRGRQRHPGGRVQHLRRPPRRGRGVCRRRRSRRHAPRRHPPRAHQPRLGRGDAGKRPGGRGRGELDGFLRALRPGEIRPRRGAAARPLRSRLSHRARVVLRPPDQRRDRDRGPLHPRHDRRRLVGRVRAPGERALHPRPRRAALLRPADRAHRAARRPRLRERPAGKPRPPAGQPRADRASRGP